MGPVALRRRCCKPLERLLHLLLLLRLLLLRLLLLRLLLLRLLLRLLHLHLLLLLRLLLLRLHNRWHSRRKRTRKRLDVNSPLGS